MNRSNPINNPQYIYGNDLSNMYNVNQNLNDDKYLNVIHNDDNQINTDFQINLIKNNHSAIIATPVINEKAQRVKVLEQIFDENYYNLLAIMKTNSVEQLDILFKTNEGKSIKELFFCYFENDMNISYSSKNKIKSILINLSTCKSEIIHIFQKEDITSSYFIKKLIEYHLFFSKSTDKLNKFVNDNISKVDNPSFYLINKFVEQRKYSTINVLSKINNECNVILDRIILESETDETMIPFIDIFIRHGLCPSDKYTEIIKDKLSSYNNDMEKLWQ